jgi:sugar lactone lactonase YvrE
MSISNSANAGTLYALEKNYELKKKIEGVTCSNGLSWSTDEKTFYYIDTPTRDVVAYDYEASSGQITNKRVVVHIPQEEGYPDGMTIDSEGMLWIALWNGWKVVRYDPFTGKPLTVFNLPVSKVTSCVFGGETLEDLYITTAKTGITEKDLKTQYLAGSLFVIKNCGYKGVRAFEFGE